MNFYQCWKANLERPNCLRFNLVNNSVIASPHQAFPLKKRRSISQFCSLVAKRIGMICCQFSNPVFTLLGKIKWVQVFHDMSSLLCYFVKINISLNQSCMVKYTWSGTPRSCVQNSLNGVVPIVLQKNMILHKKTLWKKEKIVKIWSKIAIFFSRIQGGPQGR